MFDGLAGYLGSVTEDAEKSRLAFALISFWKLAEADDLLNDAAFEAALEAAGLERSAVMASVQGMLSNVGV